VNKAAEIGLVGAVVLAVASFGGTEPISWAIVELVVLWLGVWFLAANFVSARQKTRLPLLAPAVLFLFVVIQLVASRWSSVAVDTYSVQTHGTRLTVYLVVFFVCLSMVLRNPARKKRIFVALICLGTAEAMYGLIQFLTGHERIFTYAKKFYVGSATGTYINRNHFAGFLEMILPLTFALVFYYTEKALSCGATYSGRSWQRLWSRTETQKATLLAFVGLLLFIAVVFSRSRMGLLSCVMSLLLMATVVAGVGRQRALVAVFSLLFLFAAVGFAIWIGIDPVVSRFAGLAGHEFGREGTGRLAVWRNTLELIRHYPLFGAGLGSFMIASTRFQTVYLSGIVDHAHNDYLELTAELGLVGAVLLFGMVFTALIRIYRAARAHPGGIDKAVALGAFGGIVALLLHSLADFNLYVPANALVFVVILALGYSTALEMSQKLNSASDVSGKS